MKIKSIAKFVVIFTSLNLFAAVAFGAGTGEKSKLDSCEGQTGTEVKAVVAKPIMVPALDAKGNPILDKDGNQVMVIKAD